MNILVSFYFDALRVNGGLKARIDGAGFLLIIRSIGRSESLNDRFSRDIYPQGTQFYPAKGGPTKTVQSGQRRSIPPSAHRTVRTGPYTAPHESFTHRFTPNQCGCFSLERINNPCKSLNHLFE